jgi:transposase
MPLPKYIVRLTDEERTDLENLIHTGKHRAAATLIHARILLKADVGTGGPGWDDDRIVQAIECSASTVYRVRQTFVEEGMTAALFRKKPTGRLYRKLDGEQEAQLIALACSTPPAGRTHWTMRLLADRLVELQVVESISPECVRTTLKKTNSNRGYRSSGSSRHPPMPILSARWRTSSRSIPGPTIRLTRSSALMNGTSSW